MPMTSLNVITANFLQGWDAVTMKDYQRDTHAAKGEKEGRKERTRKKEGIGEQNNSAFGPVLQDTREREREGEQDKTKNDDVDSD